jgi:hypothetical protein
VTTFVLASALAPSPAWAWGLEWLDNLSGPGPFVGFKIDARALCWLSGQPTAPGQDAVAPPWDPTCVRDGLRSDDRRVSSQLLRAYISVEAAWSSSSKNDVFGGLRFDPRTEVDLFAFRPAVMFRAFPWVDAGLAVGINRFSGPALASSFNWVSLQPRVVFTPFAASGSRVANALEYRVDVVFIPESVQEEFAERVRRDLQVTPGSFEGGELRFMFGVDVDLFRLF